MLHNASEDRVRTLLKGIIQNAHLICSDLRAQTSRHDASAGPILEVHPEVFGPFATDVMGDAINNPAFRNILIVLSQELDCLLLTTALDGFVFQQRWRKILDAFCALGLDMPKHWPQ